MKPLPTPPASTSRTHDDGARFDRDEVAAILRRATEVAHDRHPTDEHLAVEDLVAVADEVGLSRSAVITAVAEARAGVEHRSGLIDRLVGPRQVWAISQLPVDVPAARTVQHWLEVDHGMRTYLNGDGVVVAEPRGGLAGAIGRGVRSIGGTAGLDRVRRVQAATASVDHTGSVCLVADVSNKRAEAVTGGAAVATGTAAVAGLVGILVTPFALAALPFGALAGVATARVVHHYNVKHISAQIEMTTEAVVRGHSPVHPVERFFRSRFGRRVGP